jgi:hypothetical protein
MKIKPSTCTSKKTGSRNKRPLQINNYSFEKVNNFIYMGAILNDNNQMQFEIAERIRKGNRAYYANAELLKSKLLKRSTKMRIYLTLIRPVVTYASETWILTEKVEMRLRIFERQILRKIFGPIQIGKDIRRIRNNAELDQVINGAYIVRFIKVQRVKWLGHIQRTDTSRIAKRIFEWKPIGRRSLGRPILR